jgi:hypothetical protein
MNDQFKNDCLAIVKVAMETPETKAHIMCEWVAHCEFFAVRVYLGGWTGSAEPTLTAECRAKDAEKRFTHHMEPSDLLLKIQALLA